MDLILIWIGFILHVTELDRTWTCIWTHLWNYCIWLYLDSFTKRYRSWTFDRHSHILLDWDHISRFITPILSQSSLALTTITPCEFFSHNYCGKPRFGRSTLLARPRTSCRNFVTGFAEQFAGYCAVNMCLIDYYQPIRNFKHFWRIIREKLTQSLKQPLDIIQSLRNEFKFDNVVSLCLPCSYLRLVLSPFSSKQSK